MEKFKKFAYNSQERFQQVFDGKFEDTCFNKGVFFFYLSYI